MVEEAMSAVAIAQECCCGSIGADPKTVRFCDVEKHHRYWRGDKELISVSKVLRSTWPLPPDFSKADPDTLEKAKQRGIRVDSLFTSYLRHERLIIPAGTREDIIDECRALFLKLRLWWEVKHDGSPVQAQVILANDEIAGTCDLILGRSGIYDVKATYDIEPTYPLQLGLYGMLYLSMFNTLPEALGLIHVTKRFNEPRVIQLDVEECIQDAATVLNMFRMVKRRTC